MVRPRFSSPKLCGSTFVTCVSPPVGAPTQWLTSAPIITTHTTRTYCMVATTRESAPYSSAIETIAEAAPGAVPHAAVLAGMPAHTKASPTRALRQTVAAVASSIIGQDWAIERSTASVMEWAARMPTQPWPSLKA
ncbi:hypothetical protein D3C75_940250 [compost metagenome]